MFRITVLDADESWLKGSHAPEFRSTLPSSVYNAVRVRAKQTYSLESIRQQMLNTVSSLLRRSKHTFQSTLTHGATRN